MWNRGLMKKENCSSSRVDVVGRSRIKISRAKKNKSCENIQGIEANYSRNKNEGISRNKMKASQLGVSLESIGGGLGRSCIGLSAAASKCFSTARGFGLTFVQGSRYVVSL
jgi:hypothetical protein